MADSEELAFWLQLEELGKVDVERAVDVREDMDRSRPGEGSLLSSVREYRTVPDNGQQPGLGNSEHISDNCESPGIVSKMKSSAAGSASPLEVKFNCRTLLKKLGARSLSGRRIRTKEPDAESDRHHKALSLQVEKGRPTAAGELHEHSERRNSMAEFEAEMERKQLRKYRQILEDERLAERIGAAEDDDNQSGIASSSGSDNQVYDLFFAQMRDESTPYVGIGCVIKDIDQNVLFRSRECLGVNRSYHFAEYTALINGLAYARSLGVSHINAHGNIAIVFWEIQGLTEAWTPEQVQLMNELQEQVKELSSFSIRYVSKTENVQAIDLATHAIEQHVSEVSGNGIKAALKGNAPADTEPENRDECRICFEKVLAADMFRQEGCEHRFCFNCLTHHVQNESLRDKLPVRCPQFFACGSHMTVKDCQRLLSPKAFDHYSWRLTEASIRDSEKVYCPYPNCSAMMYKLDEKRPVRTKIRCFSRSRSALETPASEGTECMECHRLFCEECQVPWHHDLTCQQYQRLPKDERNSDFMMLSKLAKDENWRRCTKCGRMISLAKGCTHMTCRCGYEFCYTCGTSYKDRKRMCACPLFPGKPTLSWGSW